jgi:hypothetical protein
LASKSTQNIKHLKKIFLALSILFENGCTLCKNIHEIILNSNTYDGLKALQGTEKQAGCVPPTHLY